jgi:hypothetical protein
MSFFRISSPTPQEGGAERAKKGRTYIHIYIHIYIYIYIINVAKSISTWEIHPKFGPDPIDTIIQQIHIDPTLWESNDTSIYFLINLYI